MQSPIHVTSEIGKLKTVMLHRPGKEIENVYPEILHRMLVDDIPYLPIAQEEHDLLHKHYVIMAQKSCILKIY